MIPNYKEHRVSGIYKWTNKINGKIYVGQSINLYRRFEFYRHGYNKQNTNESKRPITAAMRKYGFDQFEFEILELVGPCQLDTREEYWFGVLCPFGERGYNVAIIAGSCRGIKLSRERKKQMSLIEQGEKNHFYGKTHSLDSRIKMSKSLTGRKMPPHVAEITRRRMNENNHMLGKTHDTEQSKKMWSALIQFDQNGTLIKEWESLGSVASSFGVAISTVWGWLNVRSGRGNGFIWKYKNPEAKQQRMISKYPPLCTPE